MLQQSSGPGLTCSFLRLCRGVAHNLLQVLQGSHCALAAQLLAAHCLLKLLHGSNSADWHTDAYARHLTTAAMH